MSTNTFTTYITAYMNHLRASNHSPQTIATYGGTLAAMSKGILEKYHLKDIDDIKGYMVGEYVQGLHGLSASTINLYITVIKLFFSYLLQAGYLSHDPSGILRKVKVVVDDSPMEAENDTRAYTDRQVLKLMRSIKGNLAERDKAIVAMLSGSGLRASELCSLTIRQWNSMQNSHIYVKRKGGAMRWVAVASYVPAYVADYLEGRTDITEDDPLFATVSGNRLSRQDLYRALERRQVKAGLQRGVHIFRHTFLTGTSKVSNDKIAQSLANHSNASTTQRYIHSTAEERLAAVDNTSWAKEMLQEGETA